MRATEQSRNVSGDRRFAEWDTGVERGLRLPAKRAFDHTAAENERAQGAVRVAEAEREVRRELLDSWFACVQADQRSRLAAESLSDATRLRDSVAQRVATGDAAQVEVDVATADLANVQAEAASAHSAADAAESTKTHLHLEASCSGLAIDEPPASALPATFTQDPTVGLVRLEAERALIDAGRARANRIPDPILGVHFAQERGGVSSSMPCARAQ